MIVMSEDSYSTKSEKFAMRMLQQLLELADDEARHKGQSDEPDGLLLHGGVCFATVEVRSVMESYPDAERKKGSGWPDIIRALDSGEPIRLERGSGTWCVYVAPDRSKVEQLLGDPVAHSAVINQIKSLRENPEAELQADFLAHYGFVDGPVRTTGDQDVCHVAVRDSPVGGFIVSGPEMITDFLSSQVSSLSKSPSGQSYFVKWGKQAQKYGVNEVHVVLIYESPKEWSKRGMLLALFDNSDQVPAGRINLEGLPDGRWLFWIVVRDPVHQRLHRALLYKDHQWSNFPGRDIF